MTLQLFETTLDGSEVIERYELWVNEGGVSPIYHNLTSYDGHALTHTQSLTGGEIVLVAGTIYKFKYRAYNLYGFSDWSEELNVGMGADPAQPA